CSQDVQLPRTF
nr:immunoglobulin light chain junction region [Macaca mulatta]MOV92990.1 immunoglobulin light chain junction region [Macaca mulatta]MOV93041.1 immunoglobulin light chain junction region [Macaca mulatta]MOV93143.1 immunoglobulin light chain junction region [Macaca mulatta]MOV93390.1 immunoglobulin light chain junction region [Macaca mulatta]